MKNQKYQQGGIIVGLILFMVAGFLFVFGIQVAFAYVAQQTLKGSVRTSLIDIKQDEDYASSKKLKETILKKISVNNIDVNGDDIIVTKDGRDFIVNVGFVKEIGIGESAKIVLDLSFEESTPR